jgi:hypothetical protein
MKRQTYSSCLSISVQNSCGNKGALKAIVVGVQGRKRYKWSSIREINNSLLVPSRFKIRDSYIEHPQRAD